MTIYFITSRPTSSNCGSGWSPTASRIRVFREFYSERDSGLRGAPHARSRRRPPASSRSQFDAMFWDPTRRTRGRSSAGRATGRDHEGPGRRVLRLFYAPRNMTAILVGDFDPIGAGDGRKIPRLDPPREAAAPEMMTPKSTQLAEKRFYGEAETTGGHDPGTRRGRSSTRTFRCSRCCAAPLADRRRLPARWCSHKRIATRGATTRSRKYEGMFGIDAEVKEGHTPRSSRRRSTPRSTAQEGAGRRGRAPERQEPLRLRLHIASSPTTSSCSDLYGVGRRPRSWQRRWSTATAIQKVTRPTCSGPRTDTSPRRIARSRSGPAREAELAEDPALVGLARRSEAIDGQADPREDREREGRGALTRRSAVIDQMGAQVPPAMKPAID